LTGVAGGLSSRHDRTFPQNGDKALDVIESLAPFIVFGGLFYVGVAVAIGLIAERRGETGVLWFALAIFGTPTLALILLAILTPRGPIARL
jgi:hypothetical protein